MINRDEAGLINRSFDYLVKYADEYTRASHMRERGAVLVVFTDLDEIMVKWYKTMKGAKIGAHSRARYRASLDEWKDDFVYWKYVVFLPNGYDYGTIMYKVDKYKYCVKNKLNSIYGIFANQSREG